MRGSAKLRRLDDPIAVSLEDLVPTRHFYRHLEAKLDLSFVREWTRELCPDRGRGAVAGRDRDARLAPRLPNRDRGRPQSAFSTVAHGATDHDRSM